MTTTKKPHQHAEAIKAWADGATTKKPHQHAEAIKAWAAGAAIECRPVTPAPPRSWSPVAMPAWLPQYDYRVAEPKPHPHQALIDAHAKGAKIEYLSKVSSSCGWYPVADPLWADTDEYRIAKPKVKLKFRLYVCKYPDFGWRVCTYTGDDGPEKGVYFVRWLGDWQEIEIDAE